MFFISLIIAKSWVLSVFLHHCSPLQSSTQLTIHLLIYKYFEFIFVAFATFSIHILTKLLPQIHPNLTILWKVCILYKFCQMCWQFLPIMLLFCSLLLVSYYAQDYTGIIGLSLVKANFNQTNVLKVLLECVDLFQFEWRQELSI